MAKRVLKAWLIGLAIALVSVALTSVVHTPLALIGFILSIPILPVLIVLDEITRRMVFSDRAMTIALPISLVVGGSLIYGVIVFAFLRLLDRRKSKRVED